MNNTQVTLINAFAVPAEVVEQFLTAWEQDKDFMASQPGFITGVMYRSTDVEVHYRFINVADWESEAAWKAAVAAGKEHRAEKGVDRLRDWARMNIIANPALYHKALRF
jgi:heme-degrading monooxygenase HmoA